MTNSKKMISITICVVVVVVVTSLCIIGVMDAIERGKSVIMIIDLIVKTTLVIIMAGFFLHMIKGE